MMREPNWFDKQFDFSIGVDAFPTVIERVRGTPARVEEMVTSYPGEVLTARPGEEWSIQEHVGHLYDLDELHDGRIDDFDEGLGTLRAADLTNRKTYEANHNAARIEDLLSTFREARMKFVGRLEEMDEEGAARVAVHPRLQKPMRVIDLALFVAEHDDHHLAAITRQARTLSGGTSK
jgi:uncharacterized damage-inducible protein DinB